LRDRLVWAVAAYGVLTVGLALLKSNDMDAEILGVVFNLRFLLFFIYGMLLARLFDPAHVRKRAFQIVLGVAAVVMFFGIVQYTVLPDTALKHVGYRRSNGVLPAFFIDEKPDLERIMSTLRDPNSFGSYLIIIIGLALVIFLFSKNQGDKLLSRGLLALGALCLIFTFSRSAWLGAVATVLVLFVLNERVRKFAAKHKNNLALTSLIILCIVTFGGWLARNTYIVQNVILHADESTVQENPNELRTRFFKESVEEIANEPLGHGPGTAGLASIRNDKQGVVLNENYYLQIGYEVGLIGLAIFVSILVIVGARLLKLDGPLALALFASFIGLAITNFLVHIWSNEAVAYTWWGLAGLTLVSRNGRDSRRG
jgi:hypothetical protein